MQRQDVLANNLPTPRRRLSRRAETSRSAFVPVQGERREHACSCARIDAGARHEPGRRLDHRAGRWTWRCAATHGLAVQALDGTEAYTRGGLRWRSAPTAPECSPGGRAAGAGRRRADPAAGQQRGGIAPGRNVLRARRQRGATPRSAASSAGDAEAPLNRGTDGLFRAPTATPGRRHAGCIRARSSGQQRQPVEDDGGDDQLARQFEAADEGDADRRRQRARRSAAALDFDSREGNES